MPEHSHQTMLDSITSRHDTMVEQTRALAELNSGSSNDAGIAQVQTGLKALFGPLCDSFSEESLAPIAQVDDSGTVRQRPCAPMQVFKLRPEAPVQILCTGHSDTVFPASSNFQNTWTEGGLLRGPGVADMKGGLVVLAEALRAMDASPIAERLGVTVAISPDEEIGSPSSAAVLTRLAKHAHVGLTYEPALADGTLAGARKGSGNFTLVVRGLSAHAGREFFQGRNAMVAAARATVALAALSDESSGLTVNMGAISGGGPVNVVPDLAICRFNIRVVDQLQVDAVEAALDRILAELRRETACELSLHGQFNRPPKPANPRQNALNTLIAECGSELGLDIHYRATGGCCEGNNLAAAGLVNVDTLGVRGAHIHSEDEYACLDSFVERAQLSALIMTRLAEGAVNPLMEVPLC